MSFKEIVAAAARLKPRQRASLRAYLFALDRVNEPAWKSEMARRVKRMKAGKAVGASEVRRRLAADKSRA